MAESLDANCMEVRALFENRANTSFVQKCNKREINLGIVNTERYLYRKCLFSTVDFSSSSSAVVFVGFFLCIFYCRIMLYGIVPGHVFWTCLIS